MTQISILVQTKCTTGFQGLRREVADNISKLESSLRDMLDDLDVGTMEKASIAGGLHFSPRDVMRQAKDTQDALRDHRTEITHRHKAADIATLESMAENERTMANLIVADIADKLEKSGSKRAQKDKGGLRGLLNVQAAGSGNAVEYEGMTEDVAARDAAEAKWEKIRGDLVAHDRLRRTLITDEAARATITSEALAHLYDKDNFIDALVSKLPAPRRYPFLVIVARARALRGVAAQINTAEAALKASDAVSQAAPRGLKDRMAKTFKRAGGAQKADDVLSKTAGKLREAVYMRRMLDAICEAVMTAGAPMAKATRYGDVHTEIVKTVYADDRLNGALIGKIFDVAIEMLDIKLRAKHDHRDYTATLTEISKDPVFRPLWSALGLGQSSAGASAKLRS
ncbi:MAG: hypothetical protein H6865_08055 [Rhodospirillales bacterium]|nr:hypothetical protein [Alphaproteobacteria bacterium]MCB9987569.1 hypothetical protein [Rhodospirillales bacterium]USO07711.1 MAG: hypothetical protein H6866_00295 [Rhodospirillales bacterium]